jgi:uncharacterized protein with HEPN domain
MRSRFGDKVRLQHILDAILEIENYSLNNEKDEYICYFWVRKI